MHWVTPFPILSSDMLIYAHAGRHSLFFILLYMISSFSSRCLSLNKHGKQAYNIFSLYHFFYAKCELTKMQEKMKGYGSIKIFLGGGGDFGSGQETDNVVDLEWLCTIILKMFFSISLCTKEKVLCML